MSDGVFYGIIDDRKNCCPRGGGGKNRLFASSHLFLYASRRVVLRGAPPLRRVICDDAFFPLRPCDVSNAYRPPPPRGDRKRTSPVFAPISCISVPPWRRLLVPWGPAFIEWQARIPPPSEGMIRDLRHIPPPFPGLQPLTLMQGKYG